MDSLFVITKELFEEDETDIISIEEIKAVSQTLNSLYDALAKLQSSMTERDYADFVKFRNTVIAFFDIDRMLEKQANKQRTPAFQFKLHEEYNLAKEESPELTIEDFAKESGYIYEEGVFRIVSDLSAKLAEVDKAIKGFTKTQAFQNYPQFKDIMKQISEAIKQARSIPQESLNSTVDTPVGYDMKNGMYVFNPEYVNTINDKIEKLEAILPSLENSDLEFLTYQVNKDLKKLKDIKKKAIKNHISETMLGLITDPKMAKRILAPITFTPLEEAVEKLSSNDVTEDLDLSNPRHKFKSYASLKDGAILTGAFANAVKVFAYISRAGIDPNIVKDLRIQLDNAIKDKNEKEIARLKKAIKNLISSSENKEFRASVNPLYNYSILIDGVTHEFNNMATEDINNKYSVTTIFDSLLNAAIDNLKLQLLPKLKVNTLTGSAVVGMVSMGVPIDVAIKIMHHPTLEMLSNGNIDNISKFYKKMDEKFNGMNENEVLDINNPTESAIYFTFKKAHKVGEDIRNLAVFLNVVQKLDVFIEDLDQSEANLVNKIGTINDEYVLDIRSDFSLIIPHLLNNNPHIKEAYINKKRIMNFINNTFITHSPRVRKFTKDALKGFNSSLEEDAEIDSESKNLSKARSTLVRMVYASMVNDLIKDTLQKKVKVSDGVKLLSKQQSYTDNVIEKLKLIKDHYNKNKQNRNAFLDLISIYKTKQGVWKIKLNSGVNLSSMDIQNLARGFRMLNRYIISDNTVIEANVDVHSVSEIQRELLNYAIIVYGLKFTSSSFANLIQPQLIKELEVDFESRLNQFMNPNVINASKQFFALSYMVSNSERITRPDFSKIEYESIVNPNNPDAKPTRIYHGVDNVQTEEGSIKVYYDRKLTGDKNPAFISYGNKESTQVFIKVLQTQTNSYYQEVGKISDVMFNTLEDFTYSINRYFNPSEFTLMYSLREGNNIIAGRKANDMLKVGDEFYITPSYNYDRQERVKVRLVKVTKVSDKTIGKNVIGMYNYEVEELPKPAPPPIPSSPRLVVPPVSYAIEYHGQEFEDNKKKVKSASDKMSYEVDGVKLDTVTTSFIPSMKRREYKNDGKTLGERKADKLWVGLDPSKDTKNTSYGKVTYQQYVDLVNEALEKGTAKGNIFHAIINSVFNPDSVDVNKLIEDNGFSEGQFNWVYENAYKIISKTGTDFISKRYTDEGPVYYPNPQSIDKIFTEVPVYSLELNLAGTIDMLIDHSQDIYSLFDLKTGSKFNELYEFDMFKYGSTATEDLFDNPRNRAKLQLMMYALMVKIQRPNAKFKNIEILHIPNKYALNDVDFRRGINYAAYLEMIEKYLKFEKPEQYEALQKLPHFKSLFNVETYGVVTKEVLDKVDLEPSMNLNLKMLRLQSLIMYRKNFSKSGDNDLDSDKHFKEIRSLMADIIKLKKTPGMNFASEDNNEMSWMDRYLGSQSSSTNPYVQMYYQELSKAKAEAELKIKNWEKEYNSKIKALIADYKSKNNLSVTEMVGNVTASWFGGVDKHKLFAPLYKQETRAGDYVTTRLLTTKDTAEWNDLSKAQQSYLNFVNESIASFFVNEKSNYIDPRTNTKVALANRVVTERTINDKEVKITNLELFNGQGSIKKSKDNQFEYYEGFLPKVSQTLDDVKQRHGVFSKEMLQFLKLKYTTNYFESVYDGMHNIDEAFPMKYLDNREIVLNDNFSLDLDLVINSFMKQYTYKQELDDVYVFANGLKLYLQAKDQQQDSVNLERLVNWFEDSINLHILGKRQSELDLRKREFRLNTSSGFKRFNWPKFLRSLKSFVGASTMWLKPVSGIANFAFASISSLKAGIRNDISKAWYGVSDDPRNFGTADVLKGMGAAMNMYIGGAFKSALGDRSAIQNDKLFILMDKFRYFNDSYDWYVEQNRLITSKNKLFTSKSMYAFHSLPEEVISAGIFYAQMNALKLEDGSSIWDHYVKTERIVDGEVVIDYEWDGTVRGQRKVTNVEGVTELRDVKGLEIEEINAIKYTYERVHGGYKTDERVAAEYYVFGELMLQLKKYMPAILKNQFASKGIRATQGTFKRNAEGLLEWTPQVIEGRIITLINVVYTMIGLRAGKSKSPWLSKLGLNASESYEWNKLSREQKDNLTDAMVTMFFFALMMFGYTQMWDQDDEDGYKKLYARIMNDFSGEWNLVELIKNTGNIADPVVRKKITKLIESSAQLTTSLIYNAADIDDKGMTKQGNLRGLNEFMRGIPLLSSLHDANRFLKESYDEELYDFRLK